ncbi:uncharacterized protein LOC128547239 [Mercenaria mercenaria]|uniref:uncharacterized protein LOC128547239 n=1 Tax=Mercenaria mercenaria TaxID=6596 RepID=UPI00234E623F|nr:uncharacterized protein LOC128547239 [Mercenaria mercenaria]XP_053375276.1 uncharacterized protein LOC128547239 [Mercenaria mercenaria]
MSFDSPFSSQDLSELELLDGAYSQEDLRYIDSIESAYFEKGENDQTENQTRTSDENENIQQNNRGFLETTNDISGSGFVENTINSYMLTNDEETAISAVLTVEIDAETLQTETTKYADNETRKRKLTADTSDESNEAAKAKQRLVHYKIAEETDEVNVDVNSSSSSLTRISSVGYPLTKSKDDTLSKSMLDSLSVQMESVGILIAPPRVMGTVFRVGSKYLMTAQHVVEEIVDPDGFIREDSIYVTFNESVLDPKRQVYNLEKVIYRNYDLDVAILELSTSDSVLPSKMHLSKDDVTTLCIKEVSFIGFGHPEESNVKHLDPRCRLISAQSQRFLEAHTWLDQNITYIKNAVSKMGQDPAIVNKGYGFYADNNKIIFDGYMQQGASGSPALTHNNRGQVKVVGILTHGLPEFYFLMPKLTQHIVKNEYRFEVASKMSSIYSSILNENKDLANDLFE